jgi:hypothetical protein
VLACCAAVAISPGCGKKGPPLPPLRVLPQPVKDLAVRQAGDQIVVSFRRPATRTDGTPLPEGSVAVVLMSAREPAPRAARDVVESPAVSWTIPASRFGDYAHGTALSVPLRLESIASGLDLPSGAAGLSGRTLSFVVQVREPGRRRSVPEGVARLAVCAPPQPPAHAEAVPEEAGVRVTWDVPPDTPPRAGFQVYRREEAAGAEQRPLAAAPVAAPPFVDGSFAPGTRYRYEVRAVARGVAQCESSGATAPPVAWIDTFPPGAPQGLAAVQEQGKIRLFWRPNREADLRGYRIYRAEGVDGELRRLNEEPVQATSWTDTTAAPDIVYSYAVTAVDGAQPPNESPKSDRATERLEGDR